MQTKPWHRQLAWMVLGTAIVITLRSAEPVATAPAVGQIPVGTVLAFGGPATAVPEAGGWLLCDGRELPINQFPELHAVLGTAWGRGSDPGLFRLPDLRGRFLRGVTYNAGNDLRDPDHATRGTSAPGGNSGNEVGSLQEDAAGPHQHPISGAADAVGQGIGADWIRFHGTKVPDANAPVLNNTWAIQPPGPSETRPRNVYVNWIIRVR